MAPTQPDRLIRLVVAVAHRRDDMARGVAAGGAGRAVGNPVGLDRRARRTSTSPAGVYKQPLPPGSHRTSHRTSRFMDRRGS